MISVPLTVGLNDNETPDDQLSRVRECRRLLLDAGADSTLQSPDDNYSLFRKVLDVGTLVRVYQV
jgi:hypothetical protein